jgi:hypothetical protein
VASGGSLREASATTIFSSAAATASVFCEKRSHCRRRTRSSKAGQRMSIKATKSRELIIASYCIIPLVGTAKAEVVLPAWPRISQIRFDELQTRIAGRFDAVAPRLLAQNVAGPLYYLLLLAVRAFPWPFGLIRDKALKFVNASILADLVRRDMIEGWELPPDPGLDGDDIRLVLAELIKPSNDLHNAQSLAKATGLKLCKVQKTLKLCQGPEAKDKPFEVWKAPWTGEDKGYALASRKPAWYRLFWQRLSAKFGAKRRDD